MGLSRATLQTIAIRTGYPVRASWVAGHGTMGTVCGAILHHTATPDSVVGDYPSLRVVRDGRSDLPGPLANFGLGRSGTIYLITEGIAWHAGFGAYKGITDGNGHFLGIEGESAGKGEWTVAQRDAYPRLVASILHTLGRNTDWDIRHALWALPPGRKIDTQGLDMSVFDARVHAMLAEPATINRNYQPSGEDDMFTEEDRALLRRVDAKLDAMEFKPEFGPPGSPYVGNKSVRDTLAAMARQVEKIKLKLGA